MIQLRMRQGGNAKEEKEVVEMTTMDYYTTGSTWGEQIFGYMRGVRPKLTRYNGYITLLDEHLL